MRKFKGDKCPTCGAQFIESLHPFDIEVAAQEYGRRSARARRVWRRRKRSEASKKGWITRRVKLGVGD